MWEWIKINLISGQRNSRYKIPVPLIKPKQILPTVSYSFKDFLKGFIFKSKLTKKPQKTKTKKRPNTNNTKLTEPDRCSSKLFFRMFTQRLIWVDLFLISCPGRRGAERALGCLQRPETKEDCCNPWRGLHRLSWTCYEKEDAGVARDSTHSWNKGARGQMIFVNTRCPKLGLRTDKALTKVSPRSSLRYQCNEIAFDELKSLYAQISFVKILKAKQKSSL